MKNQLAPKMPQLSNSQPLSLLLILFLHQRPFTLGTPTFALGAEAGYETTSKVIAEYVWIGGSGMDLRSKARTLSGPVSDPAKLPKWNYDGSSTGQAPGEDNEVILYPLAIFKDPFRRGNNILVMCDAYTPASEPIPTNNGYRTAQQISTPISSFDSLSENIFIISSTIIISTTNLITQLQAYNQKFTNCCNHQLQLPTPHPTQDHQQPQKSCSCNHVCEQSITIHPSNPLHKDLQFNNTDTNTT
ncbi:glutamine synthetase, chloroplastic-like [Salvia splendens]|uniref:glutamine synthetase, chloroplastic-like n=1 Tax=Salvia splendens TaxID=180675 RepID=UPI001C2579CA|nr:glutamine synthetase, chloroplastic-like [Salvia splendens]